jgi:hypothetical protein
VKSLSVVVLAFSICTSWAQTIDISQPVTISSALVPDRSPAAAYGAGLWVAVWIQSNGLYAMRISADGQPLDGDGFRVSEIVGVPNPASQIAGVPPPSVAFSGSQFFVAWTDGSNVLAQRLSPAGGLIGSRIIVVESEHVGAVQVAGEGTGNALVAWNGDPEKPKIVQVARIDGVTGAASSPTSMFTLFGPFNLMFTGSTYLLVSQGDPWRTTPCPHPPVPGTPTTIYATRIGIDGELLDPRPYLVATAHREHCPDAAGFGAMAWNGALAMISVITGNAWSFVLVDRDLHVNGEHALSGSVYTLALTYDGRNFLALFAMLEMEPPPSFDSLELIQFCAASNAGVVGPVRPGLDKVNERLAVLVGSVGGRSLMLTKQGNGSMSRLIARIISDHEDLSPKFRMRAL